MKLSGTDSNSGIIRKISDWSEMNFNPKLSPGNLYFRRNGILVLCAVELGIVK